MGDMQGSLKLHSIASGQWTMQPDDSGRSLNLRHGQTLVAQLRMDGARPYGLTATGSVEDIRLRCEGQWLYCDRGIRLPEPVSGVVQVRDVIRWREEGILEWHRSWWHDEPRVLGRLELFAAVEAKAPLRSHVLPANLYDGNTGSAPRHLVPRTAYGLANLFEEHRYPTPMVHVETQQDDGPRWGITLLSEPCAVVDGHLPDQWWSLGLEAASSQAHPILWSVSGHLALNGQDEMIYDAQNHVSAYKDAWVDARPKHIFEKHYELQLQADVPVREGWRLPLRRVVGEQPPQTNEELSWTQKERLEEAIGLKIAYALRRWKEDENCCGMDLWPARTEPREAEIAQWVPRGIMCSGGGMNMLLGMSLWRWGRHTAQADLVGKGLRIAETWLRPAIQACREGRPTPVLYVLKDKSWQTVVYGDVAGHARRIFTTLYELAAFCRHLRVAGQPQATWEEQLRELLAWYLRPERRWDNGLYPVKWNTKGRPMAEMAPSSAGVMLAAALAEASGLPGCEAFLGQAGDLMRLYAATFLGSAPHRPRHAALDSECEDCESGAMILRAAMALHQAQARVGRADSEVLSYATQAADWFLTFNYTWNVPLLPGTLLASHSFTTRGWSDVSVQNRHLHVYAPVTDLMRLASALPANSGELYRQQAQRMLAPMIRTIARPERRWGMDEDGEQTEQYNQTNFAMGPAPRADLCGTAEGPRGGIGRWFVPWMTVWVLATCLDFLEPMDN